MHYKNGREAKIGDKVVGRDYNGNPISGVIVDAIPGSEACNIAVVPVPINTCCSWQSKDFLHIDDAVPAAVAS